MLCERLKESMESQVPLLSPLTNGELEIMDYHEILAYVTNRWLHPFEVTPKFLKRIHEMGISFSDNAGKDCGYRSIYMTIILSKEARSYRHIVDTMLELMSVEEIIWPNGVYLGDTKPDFTIFDFMGTYNPTAIEILRAVINRVHAENPGILRDIFTLCPLICSLFRGHTTIVFPTSSTSSVDIRHWLDLHRELGYSVYDRDAYNQDTPMHLLCRSTAYMGHNQFQLAVGMLTSGEDPLVAFSIKNKEGRTPMHELGLLLHKTSNLDIQLKDSLKNGLKSVDYWFNGMVDRMLTLQPTLMVDIYGKTCVDYYKHRQDEIIKLSSI